MEKILKLYTYVDGTNDTPFPSADEQVIIGSFTYTANRMGGAPTISATVKHRLCLDDIWNNKVYAEFNGEKFFIKNTPSSSKSNDDTRYEHDLQLLSEREVLSHVYFIDAVQGDSSTDTYKSNSTDVLFFGNLNQFVERLNDSMSYSGISYNAVVDDGVVTEDKQVQFTDQYISQALQQAFTLFEIPYYFVGKTIHFGHNEQAITTVLKYGHNDAFLSISKEYANYQVINRITGTGSGDNIKYYYPNKSPKGDISARVESAGGITQADVHIENFEKFAAIDGSKHLSYESSEAEFVSAKYIKRDEENPNKNIEIDSLTMPLTVRVETFEAWQPFACELECLYKVTKGNALVLTVDILRDDASLYLTNVLEKAVAITEDGTEIEGKMPENPENNVHFSGLNEGKEYRFRFYFDFGVYSQNMFTVKFDTIVGDNGYWTYNGEEVIPEEFGLSVSGTPAIGDKIYMNVDHYIPTSQNLLPPIYRETLGAKRFYNAQNNTYENEDGTFYEFENEYSPNNPMEGITAFEDIKPTIEGMTNNAGQPMNQFLEFAYDENDNDDINPETNEYYHPYFFAKLPKYDGNYGFNLFDHAIEQQTMQISFTSGICGACTLEIGVGEETQKNIVQVGPSGALMRDDDGNVLWQNQEPQDVQNDTINNEVWIALKKDINTYPQIMPNVNFNYKPKPEDTFAILGIDLPEAYVIAAEDRLEKELIQYMWENNLEKFTFSAKFSRIFFEENPYVLSELTENSRVIIEYNGKQHTLYVDNYTYKMDEGQPLPEIEINLADTLAVGQNSLQATVEGVAQDVFYGLGGGDILRQGLKYFIRKDVPDTARERVAFLKGIDVGTYTQNSSGGTFRVLQDLSTYAEVDYLRVRAKAYFETLEIMNTNSVGGKMILTPGGGVYLREVVDRDDNGEWDYYRCYFLTQQDGRRVENRFHVGDLAISQSFNMTSGTTSNSANHYYWREVVGIGDDYIDLSKTICDTGSDAPMAEDTVCHLGNRSDKDRQGAIIFSAVDVFSPSITLYYGINDFSYVDKDYVSYGLDKTTGKAFFRVYGDSYTGARDQSTYVRYTPENGVEIRGRFLNRGGQDIEDVINNIEVEGSGIETWFYDPDPTLTNEPAVKWTTDEEKYKHIGDLYYSGKGKTYRFEKEGDTYTWRLVEDKDIQKAMEAANAANEAAKSAQNAAQTAQNTAEGLRNFTDTAFADGIIDRSEAAAIEKYINTINETKKSVDGTYDTLIDNEYFDNGTVKTALTTAYNELTSQISSLLSTINTAISDNIVTEQEKNTVNTAYGVFSDKVKAYDVAVQNANKQIQDKLKGYSDEALQQANAAMTAANEAKQSAAEIKNTVDDMRDFTDEAFADGIISRSEAGGISSYINSIETFSKDVAESYNKVYNNPLLVGTNKTNLYNAYNAFNTAKNELVSTINGAIEDNVVDSVEKADVDGKYAAFNTKYGDFIAYINAANRYIQDVINSNALDALNKIGELDYLKAALKEFTTIEGGLIQSSTLALGYTSDSGYQVMAGTNGIYDASKLGGGIASWWGGAMFDRFEYTEETMPKNVASALVRMDGTGYFAKGKFWWESDGTLHADPLSFFVGEDSVGDVLGLFQFVKSDAGIEYVIPQYPFQKLEIGNYLQIGKAQLYWDEANQAFYVRHQDGVSPVGFYATGFVSAMGANPDAGGTSGGGGSTLLSGLSDVSLGTLQDGQVLRYDAASGKWVNGMGLSSVSLGDITDLHASWDALLKAAPSAYVTRWPTAAEVGALTQDVADGRYVNISGDTMTGTLTTCTNGTDNYNQGIRINRTTLNKWATLTIGYVGAGTSGTSVNTWLIGTPSNSNSLIFNLSDSAETVGLCLKGHGNTDMKWNNQTVWHAGNDGPGSGLDADTLDGLQASWFYQEGYVMTYRRINASGLDQNTWYPVTFNIGATCNVRIECRVALDSGTKPNWSTHAAGFSVRKIWEVNGSGWGTNPVNRRVLVSDYAFASTDPVRGINQNTNSSLEYVYVRGGGVYHFYLSHNMGATLHTSSYTSNNITIAPTTTAPAVISRNVAYVSDNVASATRLQTARSIWGQSFDGTANVSGNMTGVGSISASGNIAAPSFYASNWFRSTGATGWYSETYGGGIHMSDSLWVRLYGGKSFYAGNGIIRTDYLFDRQGYGGNSWGYGYGAYNVAISNNGSQTPLLLAYRSGQSQAVTGANRLFSMELLNNGALMYLFFGGAMRYSLTRDGLFYASAGMYSNGYVSALGQNSSDARLKTNIQDFKATTLIKQLHPKSFEWNDLAKSKFEVFRNTGTQYGLIAQDVKEVMPEWVDDNLIGSGYMGIRYDKLIPVLLQGEIETISRVETLEDKVRRLEKENKRLQKRIKELERRLSV